MAFIYYDRLVAIFLSIVNLIFGCAEAFEQSTSHESERIRSALNAKTTNERMAVLEIMQESLVARPC